MWPNMRANASTYICCDHDFHSHYFDQNGFPFTFHIIFASPLFFKDIRAIKSFWVREKILPIILAVTLTSFHFLTQMDCPFTLHACIWWLLSFNGIVELLLDQHCPTSTECGLKRTCDNVVIHRVNTNYELLFTCCFMLAIEFAWSSWHAHVIKLWARSSHPCTLCCRSALTPK
jgi:hypothetical protein